MIFQNIFGFRHACIVLFLGGLLLFQTGCYDSFDFQKTKDPSIDIRGNENCKLFVVGQVIDARTLLPIEDAMLRLADDFASSDGNGMYRMEVKDVFNQIELIRLMAARKDGYEMDTYQFVPSDWLDSSPCEGTVSYVCVDFVLTPKHEPFIALPDVDNSFEYRDTSLFVTEQYGEGANYDTLISVLKLFIPAGSVDQPTPVFLTTYARSSYVGALIPGNSMNLPIIRFRISTDPMIDFKLPFVISITSDHPVPYSPNDPVDLFRFNGLDNPFKGFDLNTNIWKNVQDAAAGFHVPSQSLQVRSKKLGSYMVTNETYSMTLNEQFSLGDEISVGSLANCDCSEAKYIKYNVLIDGNFQYGLKGSNMIPLFDQLIYMNDWKVLTNTPFSSLVTLQNGPDFGEYNQFIPGPAKSFDDYALLEKCEQLSFSYRNILQEANGNQYGIPYGFLRSIGVQYSTQSFPCPTTSACHQGCPK